MADAPNRKVSFPVTVWFEPESGTFQLMRPTAHGFCASVGPDPHCPTGHPQLYHLLRRALEDGPPGFEEPKPSYN